MSVPFAKIDYNWFYLFDRYKEFKATDLLVLAVISNLAKMKDGCIAQNEYLSETMHLSKSTIERSIKKMSHMGLINCEKIKGVGQSTNRRKIIVTIDYNKDSEVDVISEERQLHNVDKQTSETLEDNGKHEKCNANNRSNTNDCKGLKEKEKENIKEKNKIIAPEGAHIPFPPSYLTEKMAEEIFEDCDVEEWDKIKAKKLLENIYIEYFQCVSGIEDGKYFEAMSFRQVFNRLLMDKDMECRHNFKGLYLINTLNKQLSGFPDSINNAVQYYVDKSRSLSAHIQQYGDALAPADEPDAWDDKVGENDLNINTFNDMVRGINTVDIDLQFLNDRNVERNNGNGIVLHDIIIDERKQIKFEFLISYDFNRLYETRTLIEKDEAVITKTDAFNTVKKLEREAALEEIELLIKMRKIVYKTNGEVESVKEDREIYI